MLKIMLDAGHYGHYNRSPGCPEYWESIMTWKLHLFWIEELLKYDGVEVGVTRTDQKKDLDVYYRGTAAKGYDVFFSLHSNSVGGKEPNENVDRPVVIYQIGGDPELPTLLTKLIAKVMQTNQKGQIYTRANNSGGEYYGVLRGSKRVGVCGYIIEHSFHSCTRMAKWLLDDNNLARLAKAEVALIAEYYGLKKKESEDEPMTKEEKTAFNALNSKVDSLEAQMTVLKNKINQKADKEKVYNFYEQLPKWCKNTITALHIDGKFAGNGPGDMDLSQTKMEDLFIEARQGLFGDKYKNIKEDV